MAKELTVENFQAIVESQRGPYLIRFSSTTCGPCKTMIPVMDKLEELHPDFPVFEVITDKEPEIAGHFGIRSVPTMHFCENREILYTFNGVTPLRDLQFVINNINDPYFRTHGEFKKPNEKKDYTYAIFITAIVLLFAGLFIFL